MHEMIEMFSSVFLGLAIMIFIEIMRKRWLVVLTYLRVWAAVLWGHMLLSQLAYSLGI